MSQQPSFSTLTWANLPPGWGVSNDPRYADTLGSIDFCNEGHTYDHPEDMAFLNKKPNSAQWKLHINLPDNRDDPLVREIASHLLSRTDIDTFKIGVGDDDFAKNGNQPITKGITVYVGRRKAAESVAKDISLLFGHAIQEFADGHCHQEENYLAPGISARFSASGYRFVAQQGSISQNLEYMQYGAGGVSAIQDFGSSFKWANTRRGQYDHEINPSHAAQNKILAKQTMNLLIEEFGDYFLGDQATEAYIKSGRDENMLPGWAKDWVNLEWRKLLEPPLLQADKATDFIVRDVVKRGFNAYHNGPQQLMESGRDDEARLMAQGNKGPSNVKDATEALVPLMEDIQRKLKHAFPNGIPSSKTQAIADQIFKRMVQNSYAPDSFTPQILARTILQDLPEIFERVDQSSHAVFQSGVAHKQVTLSPDSVIAQKQARTGWAGSTNGL